MDSVRRIVGGTGGLAALGASLGYLLANAYVTQRFGGSLGSLEMLFLARNVDAIFGRAPYEFWRAAAIFGGCTLALPLLPLMATVARKARASAARARRARRDGGSSGEAGGRSVAGGLALAVLGATFGYVVASAYLTVRLGGSLDRIDFLFLVRNVGALHERAPQEFWTAVVIVAACLAVPVGLTTMLTLNERLTTFGTTHWQSRREIRRNRFLSAPGHGFVLAKLGDPGTAEPFVVSKTYPHALIVAPTGRGKGVGFVTPNLLTFKGSVVVLDVKGENFINTARHRQTMKDRVIRVAPLDWEGASHRYNPLQRIFKLENPDQRMLRLRQTANLFLQTTESAQSFLQGGIDIFTACGLLAFERRNPTLGEIYNLATGGGDKKKAYEKLSGKVQYQPARNLFANLASLNDKTLTSYLSVLLTSGLDLWQNPAIQRVTSRSDFSFRDIRRSPHAIYFEVPPDDVVTLAPLARLFFSDLIASLQAKEPGPDEPGKVMIVLDEFDRLGRMPIVAESIKTLRSYGAHLAVVTQSVPQLDELYGENTRLSLQAGAGVKVYWTPSDAKTVKEVSASLGTTTRRVVSKSRPLGMSPLRSRTVTERTEEAPLMSEDQVRRMDLDDVVLVIDAQMPIRARRLVFHEDPVLNAIYEAQQGDWPHCPKTEADKEPADFVYPSADEPAPAATPARSPESRPEPSSAEAAEPPAANAAAPGKPSPMRLAPPARRLDLRRARPFGFVEPLGHVVTPEEILELRVANRRVVRLLDRADVALGSQVQVRQKSPAMPKNTSDEEPTRPASRMRTPARRAALRDARPVTVIRPLPSAVDPEDVASLREGITTIEEVLGSSSLPAGPLEGEPEDAEPQGERSPDPRAA